MTWTDQAGQLRLFRRNSPLDELIYSLPAMLDKAIACRQNPIVQSYDRLAVFLQLDDLHTGSLARVQPASFLTLNTSPANNQATAAWWPSVAGIPPIASRCPATSAAMPSGGLRRSGTASR